MRILVLGSKGQLGSCLNDKLHNLCYEVIFASREQIDISNLSITKKQILKIAPDILINASAYTNVDNAEAERELANQINHLAVHNLSNICAELDACLIHISTDYVFDGSSHTPYKEDDITSPKSIYGKTKLEGELAIQSSGCKHIILRTAWVYSEYGNNFLKTMLKIASTNNEVSIVSDQIGCPTYAQDIAETILKIITQLDSNTEYGIYHYCGHEACSWHDFASYIFNYAILYDFKIPKKIHPIRSIAFPSSAERPFFSVLDCSKIKNHFGIKPSNWHEGLRQAINKMSI